MNAGIPGKVVIVDDQQDDIKLLMSDLMGSGHGCIFIRSTDDVENPVLGIRLVVLDLDIDDDGQVTEGDIRQLALILSKLIDVRTTLFLMAIWSKQITGDGEEAQQFIEEIKMAYCEITGQDLMGFFLPSMSKKISKDEVLNEVEKWIENNPQVGLLFEWERLLDTARDTTLSEILDLEGRSLYNLVKLLSESAMGNVNREIIRLFNRVLLRNMTLSTEIRSVENLLRAIDPKKGAGVIDLNWYSRFHHFQTYYHPMSSDPIWTGDVIEFENNDDQKRLAVVITPQCDLDQRKTNKIKVIYGVKVDNNGENQERAYLIASSGKPFRNENGFKTESAKDFLQRVAGGSGLSEHIYIYRYILQENSYFHILLDLRNTEALDIDLINAQITQREATRICRIDSPDIEDLLQKYAAISARVGVSEIPKPFRDEEARRLTGE